MTSNPGILEQFVFARSFAAGAYCALDGIVLINHSPGNIRFNRIPLFTRRDVVVLSLVDDEVTYRLIAHASVVDVYPFSTISDNIALEQIGGSRRDTLVHNSSMLLLGGWIARKCISMNVVVYNLNIRSFGTSNSFNPIAVCIGGGAFAAPTGADVAPRNGDI